MCAWNRHFWMWRMRTASFSLSGANWEMPIEPCYQLPADVDFSFLAIDNTSIKQMKSQQWITMSTNNKWNVCYRSKTVTDASRRKYITIGNISQNEVGIIFSTNILSIIISSSSRCQRWNGYRRRKWSRRHDFKSWTRLIAFHIALIPLGKVWIQLFSLQQWVK